MAAADFPDVIIIGSRLANKWPEAYPEPVATLDGANVAEEVPAIVNGLLDAITSLQETRGFFELTALYHDNAQSRPTLSHCCRLFSMPFRTVLISVSRPC